MRIPELPFTAIDWSQLPATEYPGETGTAWWRTFAVGDLRVRMVEYSPGYLADHWCDRGHVLLVLEGQVESELRDGRTFLLSAGMSYVVSDDGDAAHRSRTSVGAKLFIVDWLESPARRRLQPVDRHARESVWEQFRTAEGATAPESLRHQGPRGHDTLESVRRIGGPPKG